MRLVPLLMRYTTLKIFVMSVLIMTISDQSMF